MKLFIGIALFLVVLMTVSATTLPTGRTWQVPLIVGEQGDRIRSLGKAYIEGSTGEQSMNVRPVGQDRVDHAWYVFQAQGVDNTLWILEFDTGYVAVNSISAVSGPFEVTRDAELWARDYDREDFLARVQAIYAAESAAP